ncbi:MAG TPA: prolyl oligopeptidase family serine peptidase [Trichormus sp.]
MQRIFVSLFAALSMTTSASFAVVSGQDQPSETLTPPGNIVVEGVPPPALALVEDADRFSEFRGAGVEDWHPIKREMLIETRFADTPQVHYVRTPGGTREQLTFYHDSARDAEFHPVRGGYFVFSKDLGGSEFFQKYTYDMATKKVTMITDGKSRNTGGIWSNKGDRLAYETTRRNGSDVDIHIVDPEDRMGDKLLMQNEGGGWEAMDWSPDDKNLLVMEYVSVNQSRLWLVDTVSGAKTCLTPGSKQKIAYSGGQFSKDGKGLYVATDRDSEFQQLAYIDLQTQKYTYLTANIPWDVDIFAISWDGKKIAVVTNEDGLTAMHLIDTATLKELPLPTMPPGQVTALRWHKNNHDLAFDLDSARSPSDVYSLDTQSGTIDRWTFSETGMLDTSRFAEPKLIHWNSFDGRKMSAFEYDPPSGKFQGKRPVLVNIHGGPESQWRPHFLGRSNYLIDELGVVEIFPNVRGSTGYGKTFSQMDNGLKREDSYKDIGTLLDWIKQQPDLDGDRIMVTGGSYGGFMTLAAATNYSDKIRCALDVVGPSNLATFLENTQGYRQDLRRAEYGDERDPEMRAFLEKIAPAKNADKIKKPLYVVQGKNDPRVPASESIQMVQAIRQSGTPVWFLMANDEGHGFGKKKNSDYLFYTQIEFMKMYLLDGLPEGANPTRAS